MRTALLAAAIMMLALLPCAIKAQHSVDLHARTAGDLAQLCGARPGNPKSDAEITYCHGFAQGAADVLLDTSGDKKPFCFPNPAPTRTATLAQFTDWVRAVPDHARLPASKGFAQFLGERFPCK
jgi:hypothetical protein